jgi:hypothetical protein
LDTQREEARTGAQPNGGCVRIVFENAFSDDFIATGVYILLDDRPIMDEDPRVAATGHNWILPVAAGRIGAGEHRLQMTVNVKPLSESMEHGLIQTQSKSAFTLKPGRDVTVRIVLFDEILAGWDEPLPSVRYVLTPPQPASPPRVRRP